MFAELPPPGMVSAVSVEGAVPGEVLRGGAPVHAGHALAALPAQLPGVRRIAVPARELPDASWPGSGAVVHDAVVAAAGAGAAGAGAVPGQHLRGGPAVQLHQVPFGSAAVQPGVAEVVPEPVRVGVGAENFILVTRPGDIR